MTTSNIIPVKYVFLDVVAYTKRTIEVQCYIIRVLNRMVKSVINSCNISNDSLIYIPSGDGMCIALLDTSPYDVHVTIAKKILRRVYVHNSVVRHDWSKFKVRVGVNQSDDNIITDINGRKNAAGAGINNARRIMDLADESQILVSSPVYENLHPRKKYYRAFSKEFTKEVKHGLILNMHQLIKPDTDWLDVNPPPSLVSPPEPEPKLTKLSAYYFAHSIKNEVFILNKLKEDVTNRNWLRILLWFLAQESLKVSEKAPFDMDSSPIMPDTGSDTMEGQLKWFLENMTYKIAIPLSYVMVDNAVSSTIQWKYFEKGSDLIINSSGKEKLKREYPEIWDEFGLGELSG